MVYIISDGEGYVKVGIATDVYARIKTLQIGNARSLKIIKVFIPNKNSWIDKAFPSSDVFLERKLHQLFADYNVKNEWSESSEWFKEECLELINGLSDEEIVELIKEKTFCNVSVNDGLTKKSFNDMYKPKYDSLLKKYNDLQNKYFELQDQYWRLVESNDSVRT